MYLPPVKSYGRISPNGEWTGFGSLRDRTKRFWGKGVSIEIRENTGLKTAGQMGYVHSVVFPEATLGFHNVGYLVDPSNRVDVEAIGSLLKRWFLSSERVYVNENGDELTEKSLAESHIDGCSWFIEACCVFCATNLNHVIPPAEILPSWKLLYKD